MRLINTILFILVAHLASAQDIFALGLKKNEFFSERTFNKRDSAFNFINEISYNHPGVIDEEYTITLTLSFTDIKKALERGSLDPVKDSSIVKCLFDIHSTWNWHPERTVITGSINVLSLKKRSAAVYLDIKVAQQDNKWTYVYRGMLNSGKPSGR